MMRYWFHHIIVGLEIDPLLSLGIKPIFYKIGKDLQVDSDDLLNRMADSVKAILVKHYLGFPPTVIA